MNDIDAIKKRVGAMMELKAWISDGYAKQIRESAGITQAALAADIGVRPQVLWTWETGRVFPTRKYAEVYHETLKFIQERLEGGDVDE
jgi:DNA-binding XRE family transcriptional regulator